MKKVAIVTFHRANNYGAVLQAHALSHAINKLGAESEILDYRPRKMERFYHSFIPNTKNIKAFFVLLLYRIFRDVKTRRRFDEFRRNVMHISSLIYSSRSELKRSNNLYDIFIAGSDQIWNPDILNLNPKDDDLSYFLDFVESGSKKNSYAASIGISVLSDEIRRLYSEKLRDFSNISVREHEAAKLLSGMLKRSVSAVCDPVLLLSAEEWGQYEIAYSLPQQNYILVYTVGGGRALLSYADKLAEQLDCVVYTIQPPIVSTTSYSKDYRLTGVGPAEFLWLMRHARAIVTTSFHGSAFGLLFRKELHIMLGDSLKSNHRNSRFDSLFRYFGLQVEQIEEIKASHGRFKVLQSGTSNLDVFEANRVIAQKFLQGLLT